jgi:Bacterial regulatory proteins, gntR family
VTAAPPAAVGGARLPKGDRWWPLQPLLDAVAMTPGSLSGRLGVAGNQLALAVRRGLTDRQADEWAIRLGVHPMSVWGWAWVDDADRAAGRPTYVRVAAELREQIERGDLRPGDELLGVHALAEQWGVCTLAITTALDELRAEGLIAHRHHRGQRARVADDVDVAGAA